MNEMRKLMEAVEEAYQGGKTEHSGAKKGKGAFYGRKKEAKRDSNKNRRQADKAAVKEGGPEYSSEGSLFAGGFDYGFDFANDQCERNWGKGLDPADEDEIQRLFHEFAGDDTSYTSNLSEEPGDWDHGYNYEGSQADDLEWEEHWAREDGDDERADDLAADAEFARMDDELGEDFDTEKYFPGRQPEDVIDPELSPSSSIESWSEASTKSILEHLNEYRFKVENGSNRFSGREFKKLKAEIKIMEYELKQRGVDPALADTIFESDDVMEKPDQAMLGSVKISDLDDGEVALYHGHGENIWLSKEEWEEFLLAVHENYLRQ